MKDVRIEQVRGIVPQLVRDPVQTPDREQRIAKIRKPAHAGDLLMSNDRRECNEPERDQSVQPESCRFFRVRTVRAREIESLAHAAASAPSSTKVRYESDTAMTGESLASFDGVIV